MIARNDIKSAITITITSTFANKHNLQEQVTLHIIYVYAYAYTKTRQNYTTQHNSNLLTAISLLTVHRNFDSRLSPHNGQLLPDDYSRDIFPVHCNVIVVIGPARQSIVLARSQGIIIGKCALERIPEPVQTCRRCCRSRSRRN